MVGFSRIQETAGQRRPIYEDVSGFAPLVVRISTLAPAAAGSLAADKTAELLATLDFASAVANEFVLLGERIRRTRLWPTG